MKNIENGNENVLLDYQLSTKPSPLEVSTNTPVQGQLIFNVASSKTLRCKLITIAVPVGIESVELYVSSPQPTGKSSSGQWIIASALKSGADLGLLDISYNQFTVTNGNANATITDGFSLTITGDVNTIHGTASIELTEDSAVDGNSKFSIKKKSFDVSKSTGPSFYIRSFIASLKTTPTVPASEFSLSEAFRLSWESNGKSYEIYQDGNPTPIATTTDTTFDLAAGIANDSTFVLKAIDGNRSILDALTLTVSNPTLTPQAIDVAEDATVNGTMTLAGNTIVNGTLDAVKQQITLGSVDVISVLNVTAPDTNAMNVTAHGDLKVDGTTTIADSTFSGTLDAKSAKVAMMNATVNIASATSFPAKAYQAVTDGFLIAQVVPPGGNSGSQDFSLASILVNGQSTAFRISGGYIFKFLGNMTYEWLNSSNSMCVPISSGEKFVIAIENASGNGCTSFIDWKPMGTGSVSPTLVEIEDEDLINSDKLKLDPMPFVKDMKRKQIKAAGSFVESLEEIFDLSITKEKKAILVRKVMDMNATL